MCVTESRWEGVSQNGSSQVCAASLRLWLGGIWSCSMSWLVSLPAWGCVVVRECVAYLMGKSVLIAMHLKTQGVSVAVGPAGCGSDMNGTLLPAREWVCV